MSEIFEHLRERAEFAEELGYRDHAHTLRDAADVIAAKDAEIEKLKAALADVQSRLKNARGAVESNQVVDKDVHGTLTRALTVIDAALKGDAQ